MHAKTRGRLSAPLLLALIVIALVAFALYWTLGRGDGASRAIDGPLDVVETTEPEDAGPTPPEVDELVPDRDADTADADERRSVDVAEDHDHPEPYTGPRVTLAGRVELPAGTPADETPLVIAVGESMTHQRLGSTPSPLEEALEGDGGEHHLLLASAPVAEDGSYRIEVPANRAQVHLALVGRYLAPLVTTRAAVDAETEPPVLHAQLGAWITGRVTFPDGAIPASLDERDYEIEMGPDILSAGFDAMALNRTALERQAELDDDGTFEFHGVIEPGKNGIVWRHDDYAGGLLLDIDPEPGEHAELELAFTAGGSISGQVVDQDGRAVVGAEVELRYRGALNQMIGTLREAESDAQGRFRLEHVPAGAFELRVEHDELRPARVDVEGELAAGDQVTGLRVEMQGGARFVGTVRFPDGSPAAQAKVEAEVDLSGRIGGVGNTVDAEDGGTTQSKDDGGFELTGLGEGPFHLEARWMSKDGPHAGEWGVRRSGLAPDGEPLVLELEALRSIEGVVVDSTGAPVADFRARGTLKGSGAMFGIGSERESERVHDSEDGRFVLSGLRPGTWQVVVRAEGYASSEQVEIVVPQPDGAAPTRFELVPAAAVSGVVSDSLGQPVEGALVMIELDMAGRVAAGRAGGPATAFSDGEGRYLLEGLDPGEVAILAERAGFAASEPVPVTLVAGETTPDVALALRTGGTLTGVVLTEDGDPRPGRSVIVQRMPTVDRQHILESGEDGSFVLEHLEPGNWQIVVMTNVMEMGAEESSEEGMADLLGDMVIERVDIKDGETTHVVLGASEGRPIQVKGRVTHGGEGVGGALVSFVPEESTGLSDLKMSVTNDEGEYSVKLHRRGTWLVTVQNNVSTGRQNSIEFLERMPEDADSHSADFELPGGRISGRVKGPGGDPVANCRITLNVEGGIAYGSFLGGHYTETVTDGEGRYDIRFLRAGRYAIAAGGPELGGMFGDDAPLGRAVQGDLRLADGEWLEDVDFRLEAPGTLTGVVLGPNDVPVADAAIFLRDETGRMVERFSLVATDGRGAFTYRGLAPGNYTVFARTGSLVSEPSAPVKVRAGTGAEVRLRLDEGCVVRVKVEDRSGADVRARVSITDGEGREHTGAMSMNEIMEQFGNGFSGKEQRVGPLPLGRYQVRAETEDGRTVERPVSLLKPGERAVRLRLP